MKPYFVVIVILTHINYCVNQNKMNHSTSFNITFVPNKLTSSTIDNNLYTIFNVSLSVNNISEKLTPEYNINENIKKLSYSKFPDPANNMRKKYKKSIAIEVTTNADSVEDIEEEIENNTFFTESDMDNTTSSTDNVTDFTETTVNNVTEVTNTTISPANTTLSPPLTTPKSKKKIKKMSSKQPKSTVCECDLNKPVCDVNCCCDNDCLESDKTIFGKCIDNNKSPIDYWNSKYCSSKRTLLKNNSPWLIENHSNDLFCVMKDNLPPKLKGKAPKVITTNEELSSMKKKFYSWSDEHWSQKSSFDNTKAYIYNDDIWILVDTTLRKLDFPSSRLNSVCNSRTSLKYLVNFKSKCLSPLPDVEMYKIYNHSHHLFLISSPQAVNESWITSPIDCPANVCIPITTYMCNSQNCSFLNTTEDRPLPSCSDNYCINMITSIRYDFYTNGSEGFSNASIYFGLSDMFLTSKYIEQNFEVKQSFLKRNSSENSRSLSGNPGYKYGKPIIISKLIPFKENNDSEEVDILEYFSSKTPYPLQNVFALPANINGLCVLSNISFQEVGFQENIQFLCQSVHNMSEYITKANATEACVNLQNHLISLTRYDFTVGTPKWFVSKIGNPTTDASNWIEILHEYTPSAVNGLFGENNATLACVNLISKLEYTFVYAANQQPNAPNQLNIIGVGAKYMPHDHIFEIKDYLIVETLVVSTRFIDATKPQKSRYARGPNFHINLPADFFYPFAFNIGCKPVAAQVILVLCLKIVMRNALMCH